LAATGAVPGNDGTVVPHFTVEDLEKKHNIAFDTANFDCEGCFAFVMKDFPKLSQQLKLIIVETHDEAELKAVSFLLTQGWEQVEAFSRQRVLKRTSKA